MVELPRIDEHSATVEAPRERVWAALGDLLRGAFGGTTNSAVARVLGCRETRARGPGLIEGTTMPGFRVARARAPAELALEGRHRFSSYALTFRLDELANGRTRLRAETRAQFPGLAGRLYRGLVIGTRGHVFAVRRMLGAVKRSAETRPRSEP